MEQSTRAEQLREELAKHRERVRGGGYPVELRRKAIAYALARVQNGAKVSHIARELAVTGATASDWATGVEASTGKPLTASEAPCISLAPLVVRGAPQTAQLAQLDITFPNGIRVAVSSIAGRDVADVLESLRRPE